MRTGELPLELIRLKAKGCDVDLSGNGPGFTLPSNIGELGDDITEVNLISCSLRGASRVESVPTQKFTSPRAGAIPESIGDLTSLLKLQLGRNALSGAFLC